MSKAQSSNAVALNKRCRAAGRFSCGARLRAHVVRRPRAVARLHEFRRCRHRKSEIDQFQRLQIGRTNEIPRADIVVDEAGLVHSARAASAAWRISGIRWPSSRGSRAMPSRSSGPALAKNSITMYCRPLLATPNSSVYDDVRMANRLANFSFARFFQSFETHFKGGGLRRSRSFSPTIFRSPGRGPCGTTTSFRILLLEVARNAWIYRAATKRRASRSRSRPMAISAAEMVPARSSAGNGH